MKVEFDSEYGTHLCPNQKGSFKLNTKPFINAAFTTNEEGWISKYKNYRYSKTRNTKRIAVIGDSYIESRHIGLENSCTYLLDSLDSYSEVFNYSYSGWTASQYLYMIPKVIDRDRPDIIIINLEENDFNQFSTEVSNQSYAQFIYDKEKIRIEAPKAYVTPLIKGLLSKLATVRYFHINLAIAKEVNYTEKQNYTSRKVSNEELNIIKFFVLEISKIKESKIIISIDGDRNRIYTNSQHLNHYRSFLKHQLEQNQISYIDLHEVFKQNYDKNKMLLNFENNYHWNEHAHRLVAQQWFEFLNH
jgi:hypothetical protein